MFIIHYAMQSTKQYLPIEQSGWILVRIIFFSLLICILTDIIPVPSLIPGIVISFISLKLINISSPSFINKIIPRNIFFYHIAAYDFISAPWIKISNMAFKFRIGNIGKITNNDIWILDCWFTIYFFFVPLNWIFAIWIWFYMFIFNKFVLSFNLQFFL